MSLAEIRVLDVSQVLAGPFAAMLLGDLGCDVIKVEPIDGDVTRHSFGPPQPWGESPGFLNVNRNKRSLALDLKSHDGRSIFYDLVARSDVIVENYRPGTVERLGIGYEDLRRRNKGLIYCSISGFGSWGRYAERGGYDILAQAMSGIMSVTGEEGGEPCKCGVPLADVGAGLLAVVGVLAALAERSTTGEGRLVETSLLEAALSYVIWEATQYWWTGQVPAPMGSAHRMNAPYQAFRCVDGYITIGANTDALWRSLCDALRHPEWKDDPRFSTGADRLHNRGQLQELLEDTIKAMTRRELEVLLNQWGVPAAPVKRIDEVLEDPYLRERGMLQEFDYHGVAAKVLGCAIKFDKQPVALKRRPPLVGEHTEPILEWLGRTRQDVEKLRHRGIIRGVS